jgi:hypothetical protein
MQPRYDEVADSMDCFRINRSLLKISPIKQIWRDHLLAGITHKEDGYRAGLFVVLYPEDNEHVTNAVSLYREQLTIGNIFSAWTIEKFVSALRRHSKRGWIRIFADRYLAFNKISDRLLATDQPKS